MDYVKPVLVSMAASEIILGGCSTGKVADDCSVGGSESTSATA